MKAMFCVEKHRVNCRFQDFTINENVVRLSFFTSKRCCMSFKKFAGAGELKMDFGFRVTGWKLRVASRRERLLQSELVLMASISKVSTYDDGRFVPLRSFT